MDEGGRFEIYCRATYRGFESHSLRTAAFLLTLSLRRGDRVDEGARLEIVCRATYRGFESLSLRQSLTPGSDARVVRARARVKL